MSDTVSPNTIPVFIEHSPEHMVTVARFDWETGRPPQEDNRPKPSYTIELCQTVSVELDRNWPTKPLQVSWDSMSDEVGAEGVIARVFGRELPEAMEQARNGAGFVLLDLVFGDTLRIALADLQIKKPSTPPDLKRMCRSMVDELKKKEINGDAAVA